MEVSPRFTTQFRDTTLNGATRTARNQQLKLEKQRLHKQQIRHDEENRINDLRSKHTFNTEQKKAFHTKQSNKNSTTIGEENNAATNIQARWRGKSERLENSTPNYSTIVQTVENEENVRSRQLAANNADIQRHRTAAASGLLFASEGRVQRLPCKWRRAETAPVPHVPHDPMLKEDDVSLRRPPDWQDREEEQYHKEKKM